LRNLVLLLFATSLALAIVTPSQLPEAQFATITDVDLSRPTITRRQSWREINSFDREKAHPLKCDQTVPATAKQLDHLRRSGKRVDSEPTISPHKF
jgi:hypothetical protein